MVHIRCCWQGHHQIHGHIQCIYIRFWPTLLKKTHLTSTHCLCISGGRLYGRDHSGEKLLPLSISLLPPQRSVKRERTIKAANTLALTLPLFPSISRSPSHGPVKRGRTTQMEKNPLWRCLSTFPRRLWSISQASHPCESSCPKAEKYTEVSRTLN